ncbi:hypothetical protein [Saliphagus infecundisoli]|uniref:DUF4190 domain-containing protein n=1 Tax=Saliphagus infecundisoli TaxID=1849069 RepID=A0ABD5QD61_9EURY|nr:hypothetical protein [Saliphagus infecundisoli]
MSEEPMRSNRFLLLIGLLVGVLSVLIVLPFLIWIVVALILAYALGPVNDRLGTRVGPELAAGLSILVGLFVIVLPVVGILVVAAN